MTLAPAIFGLENGSLNTIVQLVVLAAVVIWLSLVWYTLADARRRLEDQMLISSSVIAALMFPLLGTIVYMILRPPEYLDDVRERELEIEAARARLASLDHQLCPHCEVPVGRDFLRCPHCLRKLRDNCGACSRPLDPDWMICPYCEAEIPGVTPQRRRRGRAGANSREPGDEVDSTYADSSLHAGAGYPENAYSTEISSSDVEQPTVSYEELPGVAGDETA